MIENISIGGFKRFKFKSFTMRPLTILAGLNGAGKTSVIHSLLLAHEAERQGNGLVPLNGPFGLALGTFNDVLNAEAGDQFTIVLNQGGVLAGLVFEQGETELYAKARRLDGNYSTALSGLDRKFQYICADRAAPSIIQGAMAVPANSVQVGERGQYCAQIIDECGQNNVDATRLDNVNAAPPLLKAQIEGWLSRVTTPVQIDTEIFPGTGIRALKFRTGEVWVRPPNMGFGITHALPIILAGLIASKDGILIVESPEAHLHPQGQSQMGVFLATIAASGVQVILETHSDHVLNGIRRAIGEHKILKSDDAVVHFFPSSSAEPEALYISDGGGISNWPKGFFDQFQIDVAAITRIRRVTNASSKANS